MRVSSLTLAVPLLGLMLPVAVAEDIAVESRIDAVTVFNNLARVTRVADVEIPEGRHRILVPGLPENLNREALEIQFLTAEGGVRLGAVDVRTVHEADLVNVEEEELVVEIDRLGFAMREQEDAIAAEEMVLDLIENIGTAIAERTADSLAGEVPGAESWSSTWNGLKEGATTSLARIRLAEREIAQLEKSLEVTTRRLEQIRTGARATVTLDVEIAADQPSAGVIDVSYLVRDATWQPIYEARLDSQKGILEWVQLASVSQGTGEDWRDIQLSLSTARPGAASPLPELPSWFIDVYEPPSPLAERSRQLQADASIATMATAPSDTAEAETATFQTRYHVLDRVSVPPSREPYRVTLAQSELDATLSVRAIPKYGLEPQIYAEADYEAEAPLLAGPLVLYRDGAYAGRHRLQSVAPGETLDLAFGPDDLVSVRQIFVTGDRDDQGIIRSRKRHERRYAIEVTNHHDIPMHITVLEQLPVPQDSRITVEILEDATQPDIKDYNGRTGVIAWDAEYPPGESRSIVFAYAVTHPVDIEVGGF